MKQIRLFWNLIPSENIFRARRKHKPNTGSICTKEVLYLEIQSELSILREWMLKPVVVRIVITPTKLDGSKYSSRQGLAMES